jgi:hypothetical protein
MGSALHGAWLLSLIPQQQWNAGVEKDNPKSRDFLVILVSVVVGAFISAAPNNDCLFLGDSGTLELANENRQAGISW